MSHNALGPTIGPQDLRGLEGLKVLDLSHNELTTLEDTSEVTTTIYLKNYEITLKARKIKVDTKYI